jgi:hypothetical protein
LFWRSEVRYRHIPVKYKQLVIYPFELLHFKYLLFNCYNSAIIRIKCPIYKLLYSSWPNNCHHLWFSFDAFPIQNGMT